MHCCIPTTPVVRGKPCCSTVFRARPRGGPLPRPRTHDEALRAKLLSQAQATLSTHGASGLSLRTLARDCGTSTTAVYSLFGGKRGLLTALFDDAFGRLAQLLAGVRPGADPPAGLGALAVAYRRGGLARPA